MSSLESERGMSRRELLARGGTIIGSTLLLTGIPPALASANSLQEQIVPKEVVVSSIGHVLREMHEDGTIGKICRYEGELSINITDSSKVIVIKANSGGVGIQGRDQGEQVPEVCMTHLTAHQLLTGVITPAFALANDKLRLSGDTYRLGSLHSILTAAQPRYRRIVEHKGSTIDLPSLEKVV